MQITFIFAAASHIINIYRKKNGREDSLGLLLKLKVY